MPIDHKRPQCRQRCARVTWKSPNRATDEATDAVEQAHQSQVDCRTRVAPQSHPELYDKLLAVLVGAYVDVRSSALMQISKNWIEDRRIVGGFVPIDQGLIDVLIAVLLDQPREFIDHFA